MNILHRTTRLLVVLIAAVSLLAGCDESSIEPAGSSTPTPTSTTTPTPIDFSAIDVLMQSTDAMTEVQSLRATMDGELVSPEESFTWAMEMEVAADGTAHVIMTVTSLEEQRHFELIQSLTHVYMKEPDAGWVRASIEAAGVPSSTFDHNLFLGLFYDEDIPWEFVTVEALGLEDIRGVKAEHLRVQADFSALMQAEMQEFQGEMGDQEAAMSDLFEALTALVPAVDMEMWVDQQGFVRKQHMQMTIGTLMAAIMDVELFDINSDIAIDLPADYVESEEPLSIPDLRG